MSTTKPKKEKPKVKQETSAYNIICHILAGYPVLYVETDEPHPPVLSGDNPQEQATARPTPGSQSSFAM